MSKDFVSKNKQQIDQQTRESINLDINEARVAINVDNSASPSIDADKQIFPEWTTGSYVLARSLPPVGPNVFKNYSGGIKWRKEKGKTVLLPNIQKDENVLLGIRLFVRSSTKVEFDVSANGVIYQVYKRRDGVANWEKSETISSGGKTTITLEPSTGEWLTFIFSIYGATDNAEFHLVSDYVGIHSWRDLDISSPIQPTWYTTPLTRTIVHGPSARTKITLSWYKDTDIDFAGNGIYRTSRKDTGFTISKRVSSTIQSFALGDDESGLWAAKPVGGTINSGDSISFTSDGSTYTVSDVVRVKPNKIKNPVFNDGTTHWTFTNISPTVTINVNSDFGNKHIYYETQYIIPGKNSVFSTITPVQQSITYNISALIDSSYSKKRGFGISGYGATPSRWTASASLTSFVATIQSNVSVAQFSREGRGYIKSDTIGFFFSPAASYQFMCAASFISNDEYRVSLHIGSTDATIYNSPTLYGGHGFRLSSFVATPSVSGEGYIKVSVLATTSTTDFATMQFSDFDIGCIRKGVGTFEWVEVQYYDKNKVACTPTFRTVFNIHQGSGMSMHNFIMGSSSYKLPSTCSFIKLGVVASVDAVSNVFRSDKYLYFFGVSERMTNQSDLQEYASVFATEYDFIRTTTPMSYSVGSQIFSDKLEHIIDRDRRPEDGSIVTWDDFNIDQNTTYIYQIDAYDSSPFKNRSIKSTIATIYSGDITPPKSPTGYSITPSNGGLYHTWTNPTASDFDRVVIYSDAAANTPVAQVFGAPSISNSYAEVLNQTTQATRWISAYDAWGNMSPTVLATATPLPANGVLPFDVVLKNKSMTGVVTSPFEPWYNESVVASIVLLGGNSAIASFQHRKYLEELPGWGAWTSNNGTTSFATNSSSNFRYIIQFRNKDINGEYSDVKQTHIYIDSIAPTIRNREKYWDEISQGYEKFNLIKFNSQYVDDKYDGVTSYNSSFVRSGLFNTELGKAKISPLNGNPLFTDGIENETPYGWSLYQGAIQINASLHFDKSYNELSCLKISSRTTGVGNRIGKLVSDKFKIDTNDIVHMYCRISGTMSSALNYLKLSLTTANTTIASVQYAGSLVLGTWQYIETQYTNSGAATQASFVISTDFANPLSGEYILVDEAVAFKNPSFSTILLHSHNDVYNDNDVDVWGYSVYKTIHYDNVGNGSSRSPYKLARTRQSFKDKFRNQLDNSSFERMIPSTSSGTLYPINWTNWQYNDVTFDGKDTWLWPDFKYGGAKDGNVYAVFPSAPVASNIKLMQHDITVLPYSGRARKYVTSFYVSKQTSTTSTLQFFPAGYDNAHRLAQIKVTNLNAKTMTIATFPNWTRVVATFIVTNPNVTNISLGFHKQAGWGGTVFVDAIQLEETESDVPSEYQDTKSITADYIQGNLIRGHMIEADTLQAHHIQANTITATEISSNTITSNEISSNTITTGELNIVGENVFVRDYDELYLEMLGGGSTGAPVTMYAPYLALATGPDSLDSPSLRYIGILTAQKASGNTVLCPFKISTTFNRSSFSPASTATLGGYPGPAVISTPLPYSNTGRYMALFKKSSLSPTLYVSYQDISAKREIDGTYFSTPTNIKNSAGFVFTVGTSPLLMDDAVYRFNRGTNKSYLYIKEEPGVSFRYTLNRLTWTPTVDITKTITTSANTFNVSFDFDDNDNMLLAESGAGATIKMYRYDISLTVISSFFIRTYGGSSSSQTGVQFPRVTDVAVAYTGKPNTFALSYRLASSNYTYYKILKLPSTVLVGNNRDLVLHSNSIFPGEYGGSKQLGIRSVRGYDSVFNYIPSSEPLSSQMAGKGTYLSSHSATISLIDLLNRIA